MQFEVSAMKRKLILIAISLITEYGYGQLSPRQLYPELFVDVQMQTVFPDQKTFVDCIPKDDTSVINRDYASRKGMPGFDLKQFVDVHFNLPEEQQAQYISDISKGVTNHINELWAVLSREPDTIHTKFSSLIPLPYPYIIPGGRFREIYYWDSYFTMLGLEVSHRTDMIENMIQNFAWLIDRYGFIPNGNRTYYLSRSQPPFFSLMIDLLAEVKGEQVYKNYLPSLLKEYSFWMQGSDTVKPQQPVKSVVSINGMVLNRYWDASDLPREESFKIDVMSAQQTQQSSKEFNRNVRAAAASGWDFSSRWFADGQQLSQISTTEIVPVDLNCLLYNLEKTIAVAYGSQGDSNMNSIFEAKAAHRKNGILQYCWNDSLECFSDYWFKKNKPSTEITLAGLFPLFFNIATKDQAAEMRKVVRKKFLKPGGVVTTLKNTGQQWDAPNGWAPLEYITIEGLKDYDYKKIANKIARRWIDLNVAVFNRTGKMLEKYNVEDISLEGGGGEYPLQDGFGWTNGVLLKLMNEYGREGGY